MVLLVCELVLGTPVLAPVLVEPVGVLEGVAVLAVPLGVEVALTVPLGVVAEAVVLGVLVEAVALALGALLALVPGAEALVLPVVEAVPVWLEAPEAVALLPGAVLLAEVLGVELLGVVELAEALAPLMSGVELADELLGLQLPFRRTFWPMKPLRSWLDWISTMLPLAVWR